MPAPKKVEPTADVEALKAQNEQLQAQLRQLMEQQQASPAPDVQTELLARLVALQEKQSAPKEVPLQSVDRAIVMEGGELEDIPEADTKLPFPTVFRSKGRNYNIVKKPQRMMRDAEGNQYMTPGQHCNFAPQGEYRTDNPDLVAYLKALPTYGQYFWDAADPPGGSSDPTIIREQIMQCLVDLNSAGLNELEAQERAGENRREVMDQIKTAQRQVEAGKQKYPAAPVGS